MIGNALLARTAYPTGIQVEAKSQPASQTPGATITTTDRYTWTRRQPSITTGWRVEAGIELRLVPANSGKSKE
jgi:hypothetical protein